MRITYYKLIDPITGNLTKTYGFERARDVATSKITFNALNEPTVERHEVETYSVKHVPKGEAIEEITKEDFDALDTSKESVYSQYNRERMWLKILKHLDYVPEELPKTKQDMQQAISSLVQARE